ncbi:hypothetical protein ABT168_29305 [Streptomyces sp. NPDC001793]|uniref:hypothetical protein n=1 Tax=Streptomyces sp. NPDC001793 TaxID=3154657 RepID=UPI003322EAF5
MMKRTEREADRPKKPTALAMPQQTPPIDRTGTTTAGTHQDTSGVEADGILTDMLAKVLPF